MEERSRMANEIPAAPANSVNRKTITIQAPPNDKDITKVISHNCMDGWGTPVVTWAEAPDPFKARAWDDFVKRYTWDASIDGRVKDMYNAKCTERVNDHFHRARTSALSKAEKVHPGEAREHMADYPPWWCSKEIWAQMCPKWSEEKWTKKSNTASANRSTGTTPGGRASGTYRGGTKSQAQYMMEQSQSEGGPQRNWTQLYASLRTNIPGVGAISEKYETLMAAKYPEGTPPPHFDQEVWTVASGGAKKGYVKGVGLKRSRPSSFSCTTASSSVHGSIATSAAPTTQQSTQELARAICADENLLDALREAVLSRMTTEQIGVHLAKRAHTGSS